MRLNCATNVIIVKKKKDPVIIQIPNLSSKHCGTRYAHSRSLPRQCKFMQIGRIIPGVSVTMKNHGNYYHL